MEYPVYVSTDKNLIRDNNHATVVMLKTFAETNRLSLSF